MAKAEFTLLVKSDMLRTASSSSVKDEVKVKGRSTIRIPRQAGE